MALPFKRPSPEEEARTAAILEKLADSTSGSDENQPESSNVLIHKPSGGVRGLHSGPYRNSRAPEGSEPDGPVPACLSGGWLPQVLERRFEATQWLMEPLLPQGGVVFLHGPTSVGKSPLTWALAAAVSEGTPFQGYDVQHTGPVVYIELDTPLHLIQPRLKRLRTVPGRMWVEEFRQPIDICNPVEDVVERLRALNEMAKPVLVIVNTLRKAHREDDKSSDVPSRVYGEWAFYFPQATLLFVHHDKKVNEQSKGDPDQAFSGSQAWANDAQLALHISRDPNGAKAAKKASADAPHQNTPVIVKMTKSQVCAHEAFEPLKLQLDADGSNWVELEVGRVAYQRYFSSLTTGTKKERIEAVRQKFGIGKSQAYEACKGLN